MVTPYCSPGILCDNEPVRVGTKKEIACIVDEVVGVHIYMCIDVFIYSHIYAWDSMWVFADQDELSILDVVFTTRQAPHSCSANNG